MFPPGRLIEKQTILNYTKLTRMGSAKMLALSFYEVEDDAEKRAYPVPPLLRSEVFDRESSQGEHFLVYVLNHGLAEQVRAFNSRYPAVPIHAFWNNADAPKTLEFSPTLSSTVETTRFLDKMALPRRGLHRGLSRPLARRSTTASPRS